MKYRRIIGASLVWLWLGGSAEAGTLSVAPLQVSLPLDGSAKLIRLHNPSDRATLVQVEPISWAAPEDLDVASRASEILAVPPVFELAPDGEQVIRLALRQPLDGATEHAYRLLITEVPRDVRRDDGLNFAVRLNLPVFVTPPGAEPASVWSLQQGQDGGAELVLANVGQAYLGVTSLELRDGPTAAPLFSATEPVYVLAGEQKRWRLTQELSALPSSLQVHSETQLGPEVAPVMRPDG